MCVNLIAQLIRRVGRLDRYIGSSISWVAVVTSTDRPKSVRNRCIFAFWWRFCIFVCPLFSFCWYWEKKEEIWLSHMTKAHSPTEMSKGQSDNTNNATKSSITQRLRTDCWYWGFFHMPESDFPFSFIIIKNLIQTGIHGVYPYRNPEDLLNLSCTWVW